MQIIISKLLKKVLVKTNKLYSAFSQINNYCKIKILNKFWV
jgi:hypothetical protein